MNNKIFGYEWEDIQRDQQKRGSLNKPLPPVNHDREAVKIQSDVDRHSIPVHADTKRHYSIVLPDGYSLDTDNVWRKQGGGDK